MNHKALIAHEAEIPYRRRSYVLWQLADEVFDALNEGNHTGASCGYSLDAIEEIPAGSMVSIGGRPAIHYMPERGVTLAEHEANERLVDEMIAEMIAEMNKS